MKLNQQILRAMIRSPNPGPAIRSRPAPLRSDGRLPQTVSSPTAKGRTGCEVARRAEILGHHAEAILGPRGMDSHLASGTRIVTAERGAVQRFAFSSIEGRPVVQRDLKDFQKLHSQYRTLGEKLGTVEDQDNGATLNREIVKVGNNVSRIKGIKFSETPLIYQAFVTSKQVIPHDVDHRPNTPLGNNLISLSLTTKGARLMAEVLIKARKKEKLIHLNKGVWGVSEVDGGYVVRVDVAKPVEERHRAIDLRGAPQLRPDMVLLGHEMGHLRDKLLGEEETQERTTRYDRLANVYGGNRERDRRWSNIREWGATTYHENPLANELGLPSRGEYNPTESLDNEAGFHMISNQITRLEARAGVLAGQGDDKYVRPVRSLKEQLQAMGPVPDAVRQRLKFEEFLDRNGRGILRMMPRVIKLDQLIYRSEQAMTASTGPTAPIPLPAPSVPSTLSQALSWVASWKFW